MKDSSILNVEVSCFANYKTSDNPKSVNLLDWLTSDKYKSDVLNIRNNPDKSERDRLKSRLPAITPSGIFLKRSKSGLLKHSGIIAIDIDLKGNEHIENFNDLKSQLSNIVHVAYCGLSVSGAGYFCLIPIEHPDKHELYFKTLQECFLNLNIKIDASCADVSRLRGYSYDDKGYFNHDAVIFTDYKEPKPVSLFRPSKFNGRTATDKISIAVRMINNAHESEFHYTLLKASTLMGGYIASGEIDESEAIQQMEIAIQSKPIRSFADAQSTIRKGIAHGKTIPIAG